MLRLKSIFLAVVLATGLAACIDDPAASDDQYALSQEDAALLGLSFWRDAFESALDVDLGASPAAERSPSLAPETFTASDTTVTQCALGGEVQKILGASITIDTETGELRLEADLELVHDGCRQELDGQAYSIFGSPSILTSVTDDYDGQGGRTLAGSIEGSAVIITEGVPVLCTVDLIAGPVAVTEGPVTYTVEGSMCGEAVDEMVTETIG